METSKFTFAAVPLARPWQIPKSAKAGSGRRPQVEQMPGIVGLITKAPRERAREELCQMVKTIRHEPFYTVGTWAHEDMGVYVGWTALPNSFSAYMPVAGENGNVHLFFSGEDFSRRGIPQVTTGSNGGTQSGPSYLVDLYQSDPSFPASLDGMFHG